MGSILLAGADAESGAALAGALREIAGDLEVLCADEAGVEAVFSAEQPSVVVLGPLLETSAAMALARRFAAATPPCEVVLVAVEPSTELMRTAMRVGVRDVLSAEDDFVEVAEAVRLAHGSAMQRGRTQVEKAVRAERRLAKVVTVFGTKGGVGKSVVATNMAVALAQAGHAVMLLDLDLQFGDTAIMLQLVPERTIFDAVQSFDRLDAEMLKGFLIEHSSGVRALLAPVHPEEAEAVTASRVATIIGLLRELADFVVIDTPASFNDVVLGALEQSDEVYTIATMDVPSVKNVKVSLQKLQQLGLDGGRTRLVLNRADSKVGLQPADIESATGQGIVAKIPSDRLVPRAVNKGIPVVVDAPRSPVARALNALAQLASQRMEEVDADVA
ncbi:MAG TPA: AAA family ATPase [Coriobacteriia bacterium]|jgi:pilus assembly protein CpaE